jgi:hypothetical protein
MDTLGFTNCQDFIQDIPDRPTAESYSALATNLLDILRSEGRLTKGEEVEDGDPRRFRPLIGDTDIRTRSDNPRARLRFTPTSAEDMKTTDMYKERALKNAQEAMERTDIEILDFALLATQGADDQTPHTDLTHLHPDLRKLKLKDRDLFASVKNIHDIGQRSGTIMINGSKDMWTADGFDRHTRPLPKLREWLRQPTAHPTDLPTRTRDRDEEDTGRRHTTDTNQTPTDGTEDLPKP